MLFNQNRSLHNSFVPETWRLQIILSGVLLRSVERWELQHAFK